MEGKEKLGSGVVCVCMRVFLGSAGPQMRGEPHEAGCGAGGAHAEEGGGSRTDFKLWAGMFNHLLVLKFLHFLLPSPMPNSMLFSWGKTAGCRQWPQGKHFGT